jgi:hypothetical protein
MLLLCDAQEFVGEAKGGSQHLWQKVEETTSSTTTVTHLSPSGGDKVSERKAFSGDKDRLGHKLFKKLFAPFLHLMDL